MGASLSNVRRLEVAVHVAFAVTGRAESGVTVGTLEGLGPGVNSHVNFQRALGSER